MRREEFLGKLEYLLSDVPEEEREEALEFYRDYFEEAGAEYEEEAAEHFGSPEKVAAEIKAGLLGSAGGEFTERGYRDDRFREDYHVPDQYAEIVSSGSPGTSGQEDEGAFGQTSDRVYGTDADAAGAESREDWWESMRRRERSYQQEWSRWQQEREQRYERDHQGSASREEDGRTSGPRWWEYKGPRRDTWEQPEEDRETNGRDGRDHGNRRRLILLLVMLVIGFRVAGSIVSSGFSIIFGILGGIIGGVFGLVGGILGLVFGVLGTALGILAGGFGLIARGFGYLAAPATGLMMIGGGFLMLACAMLVFILAKWGCTEVIPWLFRLLGDAARAAVQWVRGLIRRITGRR